MAGTETNHHGTGGMFTKIEAAEIASESGCDTIICRGTKKKPISEYLKKEMDRKHHDTLLPMKIIAPFF